MTIARIAKIALLSATLLTAGAANATFFHSKAGVGKASVDDVKLAGENADKLAYSSGDSLTVFGPTTAGFNTAFKSSGTGSWDTLYKENYVGFFDLDFSRAFDFGFTESRDGKTGTWTITNVSKTLDATLDLALSLNGVNAGSTTFLFDNQAIGAGQTLTGSWNIEWLNNGGKTARFDDAVIFGRDLSFKAVSPVPEPGTLPMLAAGLALVGLLARRARK